MVAFEMSHTHALRWRLAGLAALPVLGCGPGEPGESFRVVRVDFDGDARITLTFSDPIANADEVDPNDFRISFAQTVSVQLEYEGYSYDYIYTSYRDLAGYGYYNPYDPNASPRFMFVSATQGASANQLVLEGEAAFGTDECEEIAYLDQSLDMFEQYYGTRPMADMAMFVHYAAGEIPLEGENGLVLGDIGRDWVLEESNYYERESYGFTKLSPQIRIPCP